MTEIGIISNDYCSCLVQRNDQDKLMKFDLKTMEELCKQGITPTCATGFEFIQMINKFPNLFDSEIQHKTPRLTKEGILIEGQKCTSYQLRTLCFPITFEELKIELISECYEKVKVKDQIKAIRLAKITNIPEDVIRSISNYVQQQINSNSLTKIPQIAHIVQQMSQLIVDSPYLTTEEKSQFEKTKKELQRRFTNYKKEKLKKIQDLEDAINSI